MSLSLKKFTKQSSKFKKCFLYIFFKLEKYRKYLKKTNIITGNEEENW